MCQMTQPTCDLLGVGFRVRGSVTGQLQKVRCELQTVFHKLINSFLDTCSLADCNNLSFLELLQKACTVVSSQDLGDNRLFPSQRSSWRPRSKIVHVTTYPVGSFISDLLRVEILLTSGRFAYKPHALCLMFWA